MSNSRAKYEDIKDSSKEEFLHENQRRTRIILDILKGVDKTNRLDTFIDKAEDVLKKNPTFSTLVVFQIAADDALVDEFYS
jgi:hypothetical protein